MRKLSGFTIFLTLLACDNTPPPPPPSPPAQAEIAPAASYSPESYPPGTWPHFLQHLPATEGPVLDYTGTPVSNQEKSAAIINYDVGSRDLQQCADAIIRLRAEYLFSKGRYDEIGFHFTSGHMYRWKDYCTGLRPVVRGNSVRFSKLSGPCKTDHASLRRYLDIVYTYAGTISLARALKPTNELKTGTVIITPGSPGHCSIIVDEATTENGGKVYKLAEGFMPAQSIYILKNPAEKNSAWYSLKAGDPVITSSYSFTEYRLVAFE